MTIFNTRRKGMAKGQFNIKIDLPLIFWMIALLAAHKPLLLLDFHRSFNDTPTNRSIQSGCSDFLFCFLCHLPRPVCDQPHTLPTRQCVRPYYSKYAGGNRHSIHAIQIGAAAFCSPPALLPPAWLSGDCTP